MSYYLDTRVAIHSLVWKEGPKYENLNFIPPGQQCAPLFSLSAQKTERVAFPMDTSYTHFSAASLASTSSFFSFSIPPPQKLHGRGLQFVGGGCLIPLFHHVGVDDLIGQTMLSFLTVHGALSTASTCRVAASFSLRDCLVIYGIKFKHLQYDGGRAYACTPNVFMAVPSRYYSPHIFHSPLLIHPFFVWFRILPTPASSIPGSPDSPPSAF